MFRIFPLKRYFSKEFADTLTQETAGSLLHVELRRWGEVEQTPAVFGEQRFYEIPDGPTLPIPREIDPDHNWSEGIIMSAFYNLCCLATYGQTIEELVYEANKSHHSRYCSDVQLKALEKLISFSSAFLLAEWVQRMIFKAISNNDHRFFVHYARAIRKNSAQVRFGTARQWLGTSLLWYLGGDKLPRKEFKWTLIDLGVVSNKMSDSSFRGMLANLGLTGPQKCQ